METGESYQLFYRRPEVAIGQSVVAIEERSDKVWINGHHEQAGQENEEPGVDEEETTAGFDDIEKQRKDR